ncbi:MAG: hypothetical protein EXR71_05640 [Myxococcales bacterium]|nr:hypothetical protein [Myxococcales bacterium]
MVLALFAHDLRPAMGEVVQLDAIVAESDGGSATVRWHGVDRAEGTRAWVSLTRPGPARVCAGDRCLTLSPATSERPDCGDGGEASEGRCPPVGVSAHVVRAVDAEACFDDAWPRVVAGVLLFCEKGGQVDSAVDLESGERWALPAATRSPQVGGDGVPQPGAQDAPASYAAAMRTAQARPLPDGALAGGRDTLAWTERRCTADGCDDDVVASFQGSRVVLGGGPGNQRRPVAYGTRLAWFDSLGADGEPGVVVVDMDSGERRVWAADSGFLGPLALDPERACWEDRSKLREGVGGIDIRCSDGWLAAGDADLLSPSLGGGWLAWHQGKQVYVTRLTATAP